MARETRAAKLVKAIESFGDKEFTVADLTVVAWLADKKAFGMRGFENVFPDSKLVAVELARKGGGVRGRLEAVRGGDRGRPTVYRAVPAGRAVG